MQHRSPRAAAVGVDLGTSTTTVSVRGRGERSATRVFDGLSHAAAADALTAAFDHVRSFRDEQEAGSAPVTVVAPASWERDRLNEVADAAEASGLERPSFLSAVEAAAVYVEAGGQELEPGTTLIVFGLGAASCEVGVVRRDEDGGTVLASQATGDIGGDEFDHLVLAYLSGRHRDTNPQFWDRVTDPGEETLRPALLEEIRHARERLSEKPSADIDLDGLRLQLTQQELESCIDELVEQCCELTADVLAASGVEAATTAGLLLIGGASRTPLVMARLAERIGLKPVLPEHPERVVAEGAAIAALAAAPSEPPPSRLRRNALRVGVLSGLLAALVGATAIFGSELGSGVSYEAGGTEPTTSEAESTPEATDSPDGGLGSGGAGGAPSSNAPRTPDSEDTGGAGASEPPPEEGGEHEPPSPTEDDREEGATSGTVPDLATLSAEEAGEVLAEAGFGNVEYRAEPDPLFGPWYDDCEVKAQDPEPETRLDLDARITVTYSGTESDDCEP